MKSFASSMALNESYFVDSFVFEFFAQAVNDFVKTRNLIYIWYRKLTNIILLRLSWNQLTKFFNKHETLIMINYFCGTVEWRKEYCTPSRIIYSLFFLVFIYFATFSKSFISMTSGSKMLMLKNALFPLL